MRTEPPAPATTLALTALRTGAHPTEVSRTWPVIDPPGPDGVPVTFAVRTQPGREVMVHLNGVTDVLRSDFAWARLPEVTRDADGSTYAAAWYLPAGLLCGYRIVVAAYLPPDAGHTREGWLAVHRAGTPDPLAGMTMATPLGGDCSLLTLPGARLHHAWDEDAVPLTGEPVRTRLTTRVSAWDYGRRDTAVVLFDAEQWEAVGLPQRLRRLADPPLILAVDSGTLTHRGEFLPSPGAVAAAVTDALAAWEDATGRGLRPDDLLATGQSYGGLASVGLVVSGVVRSAFAQSPSLHYVRGQQRPPGSATGVGDLVSRVATQARTGRRFPGRVEMIAGTEEGGMLELARESAPLLASGGLDVSVASAVGGHDYAWWRHELLFRLERPIRAREASPAGTTE